MWVDRDGWAHAEDQYDPSTWAEENKGDVDEDATAEYRRKMDMEEKETAVVANVAQNQFENDIAEYRRRMAMEEKEAAGVANAPKNPFTDDVVEGKMQQVFVSVYGDGVPTIALRPVKAGSYPAHMVKLDGVRVECPGACDENTAWNIASRLSDLCRLGYQAEMSLNMRNSACEHLTYAYSILSDYVSEMDGDRMISKETAETLIRAAIDRAKSVGKCIGFDLDGCRSDD